MGDGALRRVAPRFLLPFYIVRAQDNDLLCPLYLDDALVAPSSGTCAVYDASNQVVSTGSVSITASVATYTVDAADVPSTRNYQTGWRVEFELAVDGVTNLYRNRAHLVRSELHPVIIDQDLYDIRSSLDPARGACIHSRRGFQDKRDAAWVKLLAELAKKGSLPHLIVDPLELREVHLCMTLALIFDDFSTTLNEAYAADAERFREQARAEFQDLQLQYDTDGDGDADQTRPAMGSVWLNGRL